MSKIAEAYGILTTKWLAEHKTAMASDADPILAEALETIACDAFLIGAKLHRAQYGRDEHDRGADVEVWDYPRRNDWNRSAKVALISIARSEAAWRAVAPTVLGFTPTELADQLWALRQAVERAFPDAWAAIRPGFDE